MFKLRELEKKDMPIINKWRNDKELISCLGAPFRYINIETDYAWFDSYMNQRSNSVRCVICDEKDENAIIGLVSLVDINYINRVGVLHIMIGEKKDRSKGAGSFAVEEIVNHAFNNLGLRRIELEVLETNSIAKKLYEKNGFVVEGVKKQAVYKNGQWVDLIMMAKIK